MCQAGKVKIASKVGKNKFTLGRRYYRLEAPFSQVLFGAENSTLVARERNYSIMMSWSTFHGTLFTFREHISRD